MDKFDCIIIGAGPAGIAAALQLATQGFDVLVLERGAYPGSKNIFGGVLYTKEVKNLVPDFIDDAPLERAVTKWNFSLLKNGRSLSAQFSGKTDGNDYENNAFTVLRSKFDAWFAKKAEQAGATILDETLVTGLLEKGGKIVGVQVDKSDGELFSDVVIVADGVNSILRRNVPNHKDFSPEEISIGVKEILNLSKKTIEERFGLDASEGMAWTFIGDVTAGMPGGGFIYTNLNSLSIGVVVKLTSLSKSPISPHELLEAFKDRPEIKKFIRDAESAEYLAHLIPENEWKSKEVFKEGMMAIGDAGGFAVSQGFRFEGANMAIASGLAAARTIIEAYQNSRPLKIRQSTFLKNLKTAGVIQKNKQGNQAAKLLKSERFYQAYPNIILAMADDFLTSSGKAEDGLLDLFKGYARQNELGWWSVIKDLAVTWKAFK